MNEAVCEKNRAATRRRLVGDDSGAAAVEFGLIAPALLLILLSIIQFGITMNNYMELTDAVRVGGRTFSISGTTSTPLTTATSAIDAAAPNLTAAHITLTFKVNGTTCATDTACQTALQADAGETATIIATYPCTLAVMGNNFAPSCTLTSQTTDMVE
ncbi:MAG TPA: TadE/TadG family type IV pilus assembly protein [Caulobacteraceae bacterium]|jgi:Flp pilus assembly protein TadG